MLALFDSLRYFFSIQLFKYKAHWHNAMMTCNEGRNGIKELCNTHYIGYSQLREDRESCLRLATCFLVRKSTGGTLGADVYRGEWSSMGSMKADNIHHTIFLERFHFL